MPVMGQKSFGIGQKAKDAQLFFHLFGSLVIKGPCDFGDEKQREQAAGTAELQASGRRR